ncbi:hypothetical protein EXS70_04250 [Candidatus Peribacteria bacterium]|nr:hypothetical protein [Candidatus Peribacteria bacterium]
MTKIADNMGQRVLTVTLDEDPQRLFEDQCDRPEQQRVRVLLIDARSATEDRVRSWLDRCAAIPGFLEGSSAEWLIDRVTVIGSESVQSNTDIQWIQTEAHDRQQLMTSLSTTLSPEDDVEEFLNEQQKLPAQERSASVFLDARRFSMESIERWIGFFYQFCDAHAENVGDGAYEPATIVVISKHEEPEIFAGMEQLRWIQASSNEEQI